MINGTTLSDKQAISNKIQKRLRTAFADKSSSHSLPTVTCHDGAASNSSRRVENSILCVNMFPANITQTATPRSEFQISCQHLSQNYPSSHSQTSLDKWSSLPPFRPFNVETSLGNTLGEKTMTKETGSLCQSTGSVRVVIRTAWCRYVPVPKVNHAVVRIHGFSGQTH